MTYKLKSEAKSVGHDEDQHETVLFGEDASALKSISDLPDGQPEGSTEALQATLSPKDGLYAECHCEDGCNKPCASRVIDEDGKATITIVLGKPERNKWLAQVITLIDSASEKDVVDVTITPDPSGICDTISHRSLLSALDRCKGTVITRAGALTSVGDVALWLSGDSLHYSKKMSVIFMRQPMTGFGGDLADYERHMSASKEAWSEFRDYIAARGLFSLEEMDKLYEKRGMLSLFGKELERRVNNLKEVE